MGPQPGAYHLCAVTHSAYLFEEHSNFWFIHVPDPGLATEINQPTSRKSQT